MYDLELDPMTFIYELYSLKMYRRVVYLLSTVNSLTRCNL